MQSQQTDYNNVVTPQSFCLSLPLILFFCVITIFTDLITLILMWLDFFTCLTKKSVLSQFFQLEAAFEALPG